MTEHTRGRDQFNEYISLIKLLTIIFKILPKGLTKILFIFSRGFTGKVGMLIRYVLLTSQNDNIGSNVSIRENVYLFNASNLLIGNNVSIHPMCYVESLGGISIGNDVSIAHNTSILSTEHIFEDLVIPINMQGCQLEKTIIGNNVWIGAGCRILAGSKIGNGCVIAAGAVVKGELDENSIYAGIPARKIKGRN